MYKLKQASISLINLFDYVCSIHSLVIFFSIYTIPRVPCTEAGVSFKEGL